MKRAHRSTLPWLSLGLIGCSFLGCAASRSWQPVATTAHRDVPIPTVTESKPKSASPSGALPSSVDPESETDATKFAAWQVTTSSTDDVDHDAFVLHAQNPIHPLPPTPSSDAATVTESAHPTSVIEVTGAVPLFPLDLPTALQFADANHLAIAIARNRLEAAYAEESLASVLWLPDITFGPNYQYHDGNIQRAVGEVLETRRNSLFVGGGPVLTLDVAEGIFAPLIAHQGVHARSAGVQATRNESLRDVAESYFDLIAAFASVEIAVETRHHAELLVQVTASFEENGVGLPSDTSRARTELQLRRQQETLSRERIRTASAILARRLHFEHGIQLAPLDLKVVPVKIYSLEANTEGLVDLALQNRPELAEQAALINLASARVRQAEVEPFIPNLTLGFTSGGFAGGYSGGPDGMWSSMGWRDDFQAAALWEVDNLGFGNAYRTQRRRVDLEGQQLLCMQVRDRIAEEVLSAQAMVISRQQQVAETADAVIAARTSLEQNVTRIRGGAGLPIETLQSIQALEKARTEHLQAITAYNKAQFRLFAATGYAATDAATGEQADNANSN
jgi:outer membrane protein TolC